MTTFIKRSFSGGEISPSLQSRIDLAKYQSGVATCKNMFVMRHGSLRNRPGSEFIFIPDDASGTTRLIEFVFNGSDSIVIAMDINNFYFIKNGKVIQKNGSNYTIPSPPFTNSSQFADMGYAQVGDVVYLAHQRFSPKCLKRIADDNWVLEDVTFGTQTDRLGANAPDGPFLASGGQVNNGEATRYDVAALDDDTGEESLARTKILGSVLPDEDQPIIISVPSGAAVANASNYTVYRNKQLIAVIGVGTRFKDFGFENTPVIDEGRSPLISNVNPFNSANNYPGVVALYQQRLIFANTVNEPDRIWASRTGAFANFNTRFPTQDDDTLNFVLAGRRVSAIRSIIDLNSLVILTQGSEWTAGNPANGAFTPSNISATRTSYNGSSVLDPILVDNTALYVQDRGTVVRDFRYDVEVNGYRGNDLTIYANHLFDDFEIVDWAYQQVPHSIVWAVRSDGVLLGLTYVIDQNILAWHRHDLGGEVESVTTIPEGKEDAVYVTVKRRIQGTTARYVERLSDRTPDDPKDYRLSDSHSVFDGRNIPFSRFITLTETGGGWESGEDITITSTQGLFDPSDVGNAQIQMGYYSGDVVRLTVTQYISSTKAIAKPNRTVPEIYRNINNDDFAKAFKRIVSASHLVGESVSVYADGYVVSSPNDSENNTIVVEPGGVVTLEDFHAVVCIGIPFTSDVETLNIDLANAETISDKKMLVNQVSIQLEESRGIWAGTRVPTGDDMLENLEELKIREDEGYDDTVLEKTGSVTLNLSGGYNDNGRVLIRQVDPLPLTILSIAPAGRFPVRGQE